MVHSSPELNIIFDPLTEGDLGALTDICVRVTYPEGNVQVQELVELHFEGYGTVITTDFDMAEDAYSFSNSQWATGRCYGMAATSILYFRGELALPPGIQTTYNLTMPEAKPRIDDYQEDWWLNKWHDFCTMFADNELSISEYDDCAATINRGEPLILFLAGGQGQDENHAVVVYRTIEDETGAYFVIYDNNYPYDQFFHEAFPYVTYDFESRQLDFRTYTKFKFVEAKKDPWYERIEVFSPMELRVYDSHSRITGLLDGELKEEILFSVVEEEGKSVTVFYPFDSYHYELVGTDTGNYGLAVTSVEGGESATFTANGIPTASGATHLYTVDWDALSQGEDGVTIQIDSDGDGEFEDTITEDNELTGDEFILQTATTIDFDPDTLNLKSERKSVAVYIEFPSGYEVSLIAVTSITLNSLVPALGEPTQIGDHDSDGIADLMVKFDGTAVQEMLTAGDEIQITLTGQADGISFEGSDTIRVIGSL